MTNRIVLIAVIFLAACTTMPTRFTVNNTVENCGYRVESIDDKSFALETFYKEYSFGPSAESAIEGGRECFKKSADFVAARQGKKIAPLTVADMNTSTTRNGIDAHFSVYITGKVNYLADSAAAR